MGNVTKISWTDLFGDQEAMRGLSLTRPWPWAILHGGKRVENRSKPPPKNVVGQIIALHAAQSWQRNALKVIERATMGPPATHKTDLKYPPRFICPSSKLDHQHSVIVGTARITGFVDLRTASTLSPEQELWFFGPFGWLLEEVTPLERVVPCKGALGLWRLPPDVERLVRAQ